MSDERPLLNDRKSGRPRAVSLGVLAGAVLLAVLIPPTAYLMRLRDEIRELGRRFENVTRGMDASEVRRVMGRPATAAPGPFKGWWDGTRLPNAQTNRIEFAERYTIKTSFLPISNEVTYDASGHVVGKHRYD